MNLRKVSKLLAFALVTTLSISLLAGCGKTENEKPASNDEKATTEDAEISGTINYSSMWNEGEPQAEALKEMAVAFEKETGVKVEFEFAGRDVLTKIRSRLLMNDAPDLVDQDLSELNGALLKDGEEMVMPINDLFESKGPEDQETLMKVFNEDIVKLYEKGGNLYYLPYSYITSGFFYNKKFFAEKGLEAPKTWDEFITVNTKIKEMGIAPLALDGNISFYNAYYYYWALERVLGKGALSKAASDKTGEAWDDEGYLKAAELVYELSKGGKNLFEDGYAGSNYPAAQGDWALGKAGSILCGTWIPVETKDIAGEEFEFGFYPFPQVEGGTGDTTDVEAYLIGCAIPKDAPNASAAKAFLKFMVSKENAQMYVEKTMNMSARADAAYPEILGDVKPVVESATTFHLSYDGAMAAYSEWFANVFYPVDNDLVFGTITPEQFVKQMKEKSIEYWKNK
ncbi:hypothetical protein SH2C18_25900 [Clostridium sediminicola]|uniref:ABC transporter substrate-binding protein n=1 Tax=Clostridium sediminicola TaxID=3114879 RepID=UPI0031F24626